MTGEIEESHEPVDSRDSRDSLPGSDPMKALLRRSLTQAESPGEPAVREGQILRGVQRKIRVRSRGRFFADGWATGSGTRVNYLLVALVMLVILVVAFVGLGPLAIR